MLKPGALAHMSFRADNWGANPDTTLATQITPGASSAEGSWVEVLGALAQDVYEISVTIYSHFTSGTERALLVDIGTDPAGGTTYAAVVSNLLAGSAGSAASSAAGMGYRFSFPLYIKAGSTVAVRGAAGGTALAFRAVVSVRGLPSRPEMIPVGSFSETVGTITGSSGVAFTPGTAADGAWTSLGTSTRDLWWWQLAAQCVGNAISATTTYIELGYGTTGNQVTIIKNMLHVLSTENAAFALNENTSYAACYCPLPSGTELWVRGRSDIAPTGTYSAVAIGVGG
jgi:hypothetical protein